MDVDKFFKQYSTVDPYGLLFRETFHRSTGLQPELFRRHFIALDMLLTSEENDMSVIKQINDVKIHMIRY